jgi:glycosyltransferase involved in cell wall biosynthesis
MKFSIVIATYNRAAVLADTLASLAALQSALPWEVIVVDNNSADATRAVIERAATAFPAPLRYAHESEQGRSAALNHGFSLARGEIIVTTDDDVRVAPDWLQRIHEAFRSLGCDYLGGRVLPVWTAERPEWLPNHGGHMWAVIALLDFGDAPLTFGTRVPLGVNMAFRRGALERAGGFNPRIGRKAGTLLGQEVREWCLRAHEASLTGSYAPDVVVHHLIPAERLTKAYFRRWFFWRGISRALLYAEKGVDMEAPERSTLDFSRVPHIVGVPRYMFRTAGRTIVAMIRAAARRAPMARFEHEAWLWFFAGIVAQRWKDRRTSPTSVGAPRPALQVGRSGPG